MQKHVCIARISARYLRIAAAMIASLFLCSPAGAQTVIPPSQPDILLATSGESGGHSTINCDMLSVGASDQVAAFVWDAVNTRIGVTVKDNMAGTLNFMIPNGLRADVAIANDTSNLNNYILCIIYLEASGNRVFLNTYLISGVGTAGPLTYTQTAHVLLSTLYSDFIPHIDLFADPDIPVGTYPSMHKFIVTWTERNMLTGTCYLFAAHGEVSNPTAFTSGLIHSGTQMFADVAASNNISTGHLLGYFSIFKYPTLDFAQLDCNTGIVNYSTLSSPFSGTPTARIEAMGLYDPIVSPNPWNIVVSKSNGVNSDIVCFNNNHLGGLVCSAPVFSGRGNFFPAVAAGIGPSVAEPCNQNYFFVWIATGGSDTLVSRGVSYFSGNVGTPNFYKVNSGAIFNPPIFNAYAISSCSNSGDSLITAWYTGGGSGNIYYKITKDITGYKPTDIEELKSSPYALYPNPAQDQVTLKTDGIAHLKHISIYSILGRMVYSADVSGTLTALNTSAFANGLYQVVIDTDKGQATKKLEIVK